MKTFDTAKSDEPPIPAGPARGIGRTGRRRPAFGSYMDRELQKQFKLACILADVEMQDGLDEAVRMWLEKQQRAK